MIKEKLSLTKRILERNPHTRGDGHGSFLNVVATKLFPDGRIDFNCFNVESWTRARRKVLADNHHLDARTKRTTQAEAIVRSEVA